MSIGKSWNGEELLELNKLHTVMETLNSRSEDRDLAVDEEQIASLRSLLKEALGERPPSTMPVVVRSERGCTDFLSHAEAVPVRPRQPPFTPCDRLRRGPQQRRRPALRLASLLIRRRRCVEIHFRLQRVSTPAPAPALRAPVSEPRPASSQSGAQLRRPPWRP